jgi:16S rRNA (cytosine967-C5)-methyltransferase
VSVAPARAVAFGVIRRVFEHDAYADRALAAQASGLERRDRSLAMALAYGTVQRKATLDEVARRLCDGPLSRLEPGVLAALRLGLQQILLMDGIADHAAVNESVELARASSRGGSGLVNAVLRRATREGRQILASFDDRTPEHAAVLHSVPPWLARLWWQELGAERARTLLAASNDPPESVLRVNTLRATREQVIEQLPVAARPVAALPEAVVLEEPFDVQGSELFTGGAIMAQSRGSMLAGLALAPAAGSAVLDLCAAPGAKATQLGALIGAEGRLTAVERHPGRAAALERTLQRMGIGWAQVRVADAAQPLREDREAYDAVLVDPPCSGLGTLQSRPDLRWRTGPERIADLKGLQLAILRAGAQATSPGGTLVYSVCTISRSEGVEVVRALLHERPEFAAQDLGELLPVAADGPFLQTMPDRDGTDGFFIARLRRR